MEGVGRGRSGGVGSTCTDISGYNLGLKFTLGGGESPDAMKSKSKGVPATRNWVAKHAQQIHRPKVEPNKKKAYVRTPKHRHRDFGVSSSKV